MLDAPAPTAHWAPLIIDDTYLVAPTEFARTDDELVLARNMGPLQSVALVTPQAVPEPATLLLLGSACVLAARRYRRT